MKESGIKEELEHNVVAPHETTINLKQKKYAVGQNHNSLEFTKGQGGFCNLQIEWKYLYVGLVGFVWKYLYVGFVWKYLYVGIVGFSGFVWKYLYVGFVGFVGVVWKYSYVGFAWKYLCVGFVGR